MGEVGYQLWTSETTGYRRRGTKLAELVSVLGSGAVTQTILEPLRCASASEPAVEARRVLLARGFDVAGVQEFESGPVIGMVATQDLTEGVVRDHLNPIQTIDRISDNTPVANLLHLLKCKERVFVASEAKVWGIVTRADLNKPPIRVYLFGLISLLEMHLQFWISAEFAEESWIDHLPVQRLEDAKALQRERHQADAAIGLLDCLQFCDKASLFSRSIGLISKFALGSKSMTRDLLGGAERLRNDLAHSQLDLAHGTSWERILKRVEGIEKFVHTSDQIIEQQAQRLRDGFDDGLWVALR